MTEWEDMAKRGQREKNMDRIEVKDGVTVSTHPPGGQNSREGLLGDLPFFAAHNVGDHLQQFHPLPRAHLPAK